VQVQVLFRAICFFYWGGLVSLKKRLFGKTNDFKVYNSVLEDLFFLKVAEAFALIFKAQAKRDTLTTAYVGKELYKYTESMLEMGFFRKDHRHSFFAGDPKIFHFPFNAKEDITRFDFDLILGPDHIDLIYFSEAIKATYKKMKRSNFHSCLNLQKIMIVSALVCLLPNDSKVLEVGAYQCGTTIFIAQLCRELNKKIKIYACDTFEGMPSATTQDKKDPIFYDSGLFTDNPLRTVQENIRNQKSEKSIELVKGDVVETLPKLKDINFGLVFLDTDQYKGTKVGLEFLKGQTSPFPDVIVDDTTLSGVNLAIDEFLDNDSPYIRKNLSTNFDYLVPPKNVKCAL